MSVFFLFYLQSQSFSISAFSLLIINIAGFIDIDLEPFNHEPHADSTKFFIKAYIKCDMKTVVSMARFTKFNTFEIHLDHASAGKAIMTPNSIPEEHLNQQFSRSETCYQPRHTDYGR